MPRKRVSPTDTGTPVPAATEPQPSVEPLAPANLSAQTDWLPAHPDGIRVRPATLADLFEGASVLVLREHAGESYLDDGTVTKVRERPVHARQGRYRQSSDGERVGSKYEISLKTVFGMTTSTTLYESAAVFDAEFPPDRPETFYLADRHQALIKHQQPRAFVPEPHGPFQIRPTPIWGAQATVSMFVPGISPDALQEALQQVLEERFPGHRHHGIKTRPTEDLRVNVYSVHYKGAHLTGDGEPAMTPLALNVLAGEGFMIGGNGCMIQQVAKQASKVIVGPE